MQEKTFESVLKEVKGKKILVANRGIPARRIIRSIHEIFEAIAVLTVTDVDKTAPFTSGAHEFLLLGENPRAYLDIDKIVELAKSIDVGAIHPGWGFVSEDSVLPMKCEKAGILFIGPSAEAMSFLGNKVKARNLARKLGIPIVPGSENAVSVSEAKQIAKEIGFPVMLKAEGGGGGRGIYEVYHLDELKSCFIKASTLAQASFGNSRLYVEKLLPSVRHIEIQVVADRYGRVFTFDERDCSLQRNHQKLVEITPSPWRGLTLQLRKRLKQYARDLVKAVGYYSLATVEFLVDPEGNPYLMEVNTRLQVEHGITECRYGIDLVEEQIAIAFGAKLRFNEKEARPSNYAMQLRINCEDPRDNFAPSSGMITRYISPGGPGIRLDSCVSSDYEFPSDYDSAMSLLIAYGKSWPKVLGIMNRALDEYFVSGVKTTIPFFKQVINHPDFQAGEFDTQFIIHTPTLRDYKETEPEHLGLAKLVAEISARGYNPFVDLGKYRGVYDQRLGRFNPVLPEIGPSDFKYPYPRGDREAILDYIRDSGYIHFTDTTARDITQSNSGNRFRVAEEELIGPYLDKCGFFSLEIGGGAHFHVAMLANMTYPFTEAKEWNHFAPHTLKQILIRSTNTLGYKPQPKNIMRITAELICEQYDVIRCFDFLNHIENMYPFAEVVLNSKVNIFQPAISLSWAKGFDVLHYLDILEEIVAMIARATGVARRKATKNFILGLKDMAGVCPPRFIAELVSNIRKRYPELIIHYHRHYTDGLFVPAVGLAAKAGAHIVDTGIGAAVRWYGQGDVLSTAAYIEGELGLKTNLNKDMIGKCNFVLKQIMPYFDRYVAPYFQGVDYEVTSHGMPGGATSSSQEGALKQGYIKLLPYMLRFLSGTRKIVRYHDVTPGSQITWNIAFLAVTSAFKRGGEKEVQHLLRVLESIIDVSEEELSEELKKERLMIYRESNDAFRDLLLGRFGRLPLGFPPDWVYESAFGSGWKEAIKSRTQESPLKALKDIDIEREKETLASQLGRAPSKEELVMYLNHPTDALKTIQFQHEYGNPNRIPLDVWFEGLEVGAELHFQDSNKKPHVLTLLDISEPDEEGMSQARYILDSEVFTYCVQVAEKSGVKKEEVEMANKDNIHHIGSPSNGDLWMMHVAPGDLVKKGEEVFNITIMKQEKSVLAPVDGVVKRVLKFADYRRDKKMISVREGELLVELGPISGVCPGCSAPLLEREFKFCPECGVRLREKERGTV